MVTVKHCGRVQRLLRTGRVPSGRNVITMHLRGIDHTVSLDPRQPTRATCLSLEPRCELAATLWQVSLHDNMVTNRSAKGQKVLGSFL